MTALDGVDGYDAVFEDDDVICTCCLSTNKCIVAATHMPP